MIKYKKNTTKFFSIQSVQGATREGQEPISEVENRCSSAADMWRDVHASSSRHTYAVTASESMS